jgi:hypothetical protein
MTEPQKVGQNSTQGNKAPEKKSIFLRLDLEKKIDLSPTRPRKKIDLSPTRPLAIEKKFGDTRDTTTQAPPKLQERYTPHTYTVFRTID